jgi:RNA polymerase sigma factor (sigma-70 family)
MREKASMAEFRELYDRQITRVYKLALVLLGSVADAEDVVQTVFLKIWEKNPKFHDADHETAWLLTTTRNQCRDLQKSYYRKHRTAIEDAPEKAVSFASNADNEIWQALQSLPEKYRVVLYLYYYEGYPVKELSVLLGRRESTLQTRLATGRKLLKESLSNTRL